MERNLALYSENQKYVYAVSVRMLLDVTENPDSSWLKQWKAHHLITEKAREARFRAGISALCHPQQHWLLPRLGCLSGRGLEEGKERHTEGEAPTALVSLESKFLPLSRIEPT